MRASRSLKMRAMVGAGAAASILTGLAAGWITVSAMAPSTAREPTRPWRHVESTTSADPLPQSPTALASLAPAYFSDGTAPTMQPEPATYDMTERRWDAETRRLEAKLDAMIRQGERDAKRMGDQIKTVSLEQESGAAESPVSATPSMAASPDDDQADDRPRTADQPLTPST